MNKFDSESISGLLQGVGLEHVDVVENADIAIFLTCCVREKADERLYGQVASMKNLPLRASSPLSKRYVCIGGCIGQRDGDGLFDKLPHVDVVFGTHNINEVPHLLDEAMNQDAKVVSLKEGRAEFHDDLVQSREHLWAAWLPITVGCNNFCTYCVVPYVRGREVSLPIEEVEAKAAELVASGVKEITLLGQNVNSYGRDLYGQPRFADVLDVVSASGVERIRFATSHPKDLTDEVIERFASLPNLMPAIHLPLQSGSDAVLKAMNRSYTAAHYLELVDKLKEARAEIALSTDVIVGFPGETEQDFLATCDIVRRVGYTQVFSFIYSRREGTPAAKMDDPTPHEEIMQRFERLRTFVEDGAIAANEPFVGQTLDVLFEGGSKKGDCIATGKSPHNVTVHVPLSSTEEVSSLEGRIVPVHIEQARTWYLNGVLA